MTQSLENQLAAQEHSPENYPLLMQLLGGKLVGHFSQASSSCLNALERIAGQIGQAESNLLEALESAVTANELGRGYTPGIADYALVTDLAEALKSEYPLFSRLTKIKGFCQSAGEGSDIGLQQLIIPFSEMASPDPLVVDAMLELARGEGKSLNIDSSFLWVLVHAQDVFDTAEDHGNFRYQHLRDKLNELAVMVVDNDKDGKCLSKVQNIAGANLSRLALIGIRDEYIEQRDRELNPKFRLLAAQAGKRNVFAQTLYDTLELMNLSLDKVQNLEKSGISVHGHEAYEVTNLASLILRTLNMDTAAMIESFKLESKKNLNNFRGISWRSCRTSGIWNWKLWPKLFRANAGFTATAIARMKSWPCCESLSNTTLPSGLCSTSWKATRWLTSWQSTAPWRLPFRTGGPTNLKCTMRFHTLVR